MRPEEFDECINKLSDVFGERNYPEIRRKAMWAGLSGFRNGVLAKAVDGLLLNSRQAPLYTELREACVNEIRSHQQSLPTFTVHECDDCGTNGVIEMTGYFMGKLTTAFAACESCELGRRNCQGGVVQPISRMKQRGWAVYRPRMVMENRNVQVLPREGA